MIDPESLLRQVQSLIDEEGNADPVDLLLNVVDDALGKKEYDYVGQLMLAALKVADECNMVILISLLSTTILFKSEIGFSRDWLYSATMARALNERPIGNVKSLLVGLEGNANPWAEEG